MQEAGYCECGCGEKTRLATQTTTALGYVKGQPIRFIAGHQRRLSAVEFLVEDCGYMTPCWVWQRARVYGYGVTWANGRMRQAHRHYYQQRHGSVASDLTIDHLCRNRSCVNPDHLEPVPNAVNVQRGAAAKVTPEIVREIRRRAAAGEVQRAIAEDFGIAPNTVSCIAARKRWANVTDA